jgi:hypothetical protein
MRTTEIWQPQDAIAADTKQRMASYVQANDIIEDLLKWLPPWITPMEAALALVSNEYVVSPEDIECIKTVYWTH